MIELPGAVERFVLSRRLLRPAERVLVAVSGGLDSMVLWRVLTELAPAHRWGLAVAHFNHQLRGAASDEDERFVRRAARRLGCPCQTGRGDVQALAKASGFSIEMAARQMRHDFLAKTARELGIRSIALAHHADDQVELFLLRLLRGAGPLGLGGMQPSAPSPADGRLQLIRPLLPHTKATLRQFGAASKISFREDTSNRSPDFLRNRIREELIPLLRDRFQPGLEEVVLRAMTLLGDTADFVATESERWLAHPHPADFKTLHPALQRSILLAQLRSLGVEEEFGLVEELRLQADKPIMVKPGQTVARNRQGRLAVHELKATLFTPGRLELDLEGGRSEASFGKLELSWKFGRGGSLPSHKPGVEYFDAEKVGMRIVLRHWQPGDRFTPIGFTHAVKLQDWFTNLKVPRDRRRELVVAASLRGEIFWVEGQRISELHKVTAQTRRRLRWSWRRL